MPIRDKYSIILPEIKSTLAQIRPQTMAVALLIFISATAQALSPLGLRAVINALTYKDIHLALFGIILYSSMIFASRGAQARLSLQFGQFWRPIRKNVWISVYKKVMAADSQTLGQKSTGEISQIISDGLSGLRTTLRSFIFGVIPTIIQAIVVLIVVIHLGHYEFLIAIAGFAIVYGLVFHLGTRHQVEVQRKAIDADTRVAGLGSDIIYGRESAKLFGIQGKLSDRLSSALEKSEQNWSRSSTILNRNELILVLIFVLSLATTLGVCTYQVSIGSMSIGDFVLINAYMFQIMTPVERISSSSRELLRGAARFENLSSFLQKQNSSDVPLDQHKTLNPSPLSLSVENLFFGYGPEHQVIRGASFQIEAGKSIAIVGRSGSGKSTLWRIICNLYEPASGSIELDGTPTRNIEAASFRNSIAVTQQENTMYNATILENITLWSANYSQKEIDDLLRIVSLQDLTEKLPRGINTPVGERGYRLSGGERQRVALARAIFRKPRLLILDEATSALDPETENSVLHNIFKGNFETTIIMITHKLSLIRNVDKILVLHDGLIAEHGSHDELLALNGNYSAMWAAQNAVAT